MIILHAYTSDEYGDHYLDDRVPHGTPVKWTAYERRGEESPWEIDGDDYYEVLTKARARADELGCELRIEHDLTNIYHQRTSIAVATTLGWANYTHPEISLVLFGPKGGHAGSACLSPEEARKLAERLIKAANEVDPQ